MNKSLFPSSAITAATVGSAGALPLAVEVAWDFDADRPIFTQGEPVLVYGLEAVKVWAWNAMKNVRFRYRHHTWGYGCELERLTGQSFDGDVKRAEAARYFREALEINPYITGIENITASLMGDTLTVQGLMRTIYGQSEVAVSV